MRLSLDSWDEIGVSVRAPRLAYGLVAVVVAFGGPAACKKKPVEIEASGTHTPRRPLAVELPEDEPKAAPPVEAPAPSATAEAAPSQAPQVEAAAVFPLPLIEGSTVQRRMEVLPGAARETQQVVLRVEKPIADVAEFYRSALEADGYKVQRIAPDEAKRVVLNGTKGDRTSIIVVMINPADKATIASLTTSRRVPKAKDPTQVH